MGEGGRCLVDRGEVVARQLEQRPDLGAFIGDGGTLGVVLVIGGGELGSGDHVVESALEIGDLLHHPGSFVGERIAQGVEVGGRGHLPSIASAVHALQGLHATVR